MVVPFYKWSGNTLFKWTELMMTRSYNEDGHGMFPTHRKICRCPISQHPGPKPALFCLQSCKDDARLRSWCSCASVNVCTCLIMFVLYGLATRLVKKMLAVSAGYHMPIDLRSVVPIVPTGLPDNRSHHNAARPWYHLDSTSDHGGSWNRQRCWNISRELWL